MARPLVDECLHTSLTDEFEVADALPETCPCTLDRITGDWLP
jgi:hypothetical protein